MVGLVIGVMRSVWLGPLSITASTQSVKVNINSTLSQLIAELYQQKLIEHPWFLKRIAVIEGYSDRLRYGEYRLTTGMNAAQLLENIVKGKAMLQHQITFIEGWTFSKVLAELNADPDVRHTLRGKTDAQLKSIFGYPAVVPNGQFFPDTYHFVWGNSDVTILKRAHAKMQRVLDQAWADREPGLPYNTPYQALIVASLIESEVSLPSERPIVASVIVNRLRKGMRLQIDTTVLFAMGRPYGTRLLHRDLRFKSEYNTYLHYGLPPAPIAMPSAGSIEAAVHPVRTTYLYYVARGDGSHRFSTTYKGQIQGIKEYRQFQQGASGSLQQQKLELKVLYSDIAAHWLDWGSSVLFFSVGVLR